jgi:hypothetical protein
MSVEYQGGRDLLLRLVDQNPGMVRAARTGSAKKAIRLFCLECLGGSPSEVKGCTDQICPLWPFRMGRGFQDPELPIPAKQELSDEELERMRGIAANARAAKEQG